MGRKNRNWFPGAKLHITSRGIRRSPLFFEDEDYLEYLSLIAETKSRYPFILHTYCLMTNHTHLQLETIEFPPSTIMKHLNTKYAKYFNKKYDYSGHVFEKRYGAEFIDSRAYELDLSKYVHLNPVKAGIVNFPEDYPWSSYRAYLHKEESPLIDKHQILSYFPNSYFDNYESFIKSPVIDISNMEAELCGQK